MLTSGKRRVQVSIDQQFVEFVVKSLVTKPDAVQVVRSIDEKGVLLELTVDPEDLGRVIGKRGATAQSIRTLLRALGTKNDARYNLKIVDNGPGAGSYGEGRPPREDNRTEPERQPVEEDAWSTPSAKKDDGNQEEDVVAKTRKELEDLDDLDV
jgi:uncharacterized protein